MRARTFFGNKISPILKKSGWEYGGASEWMTDAWIAMYHCGKWSEDLNDVKKGQLKEIAIEEIKNVTDDVIVERVKISVWKTLYEYDFTNKKFTFASCGESEFKYSPTWREWSMVFPEIEQPNKKCLTLMKARYGKIIPFISFNESTDIIRFFKLGPSQAEQLISHLYSNGNVCGKKGRNGNHPIGDVYIDYVADIKTDWGGTSFNQLEATIVGAYYWLDNSRSNLLGVAGNVTRESAYR